MLSSLLVSRLRLKRSRAEIAYLCNIPPAMLRDWEFGIAAVLGDRVGLLCDLLKIKSGSLSYKLVKRACLLCDDSRVIEGAHLVPKTNAAESVDHLRPENIAALCPTHHSLFDRGELTENEIERLYLRISEALVTCGGEYSGECTNCVYKFALNRSTVIDRFCYDSRLRRELGKKNADRLVLKSDSGDSIPR